MGRVTAHNISKVVLICLAHFSAACLGGSAQETKPIKEHALISEFKTPPPSLNEMILSADAVVVGRLTGSRPNDKQYPGVPAPRIRTLWTLEVREVLHYQGLDGVPDEVLIEREGGDRDRGSHIERVTQREFPDFQSGQEYVLFLRKADGMWWPAYGPDGAFLLARGRIQPLGSSKVAVSEVGKAEEDFLRILRNFGSG